MQQYKTIGHWGDMPKECNNNADTCDTKYNTRKMREIARHWIMVTFSPLIDLRISKFVCIIHTRI